MPIYDFLCLNCDQMFEELVLGYESKSIACPYCKSHRIKKLLAAAAIQMKEKRGYHPPGDHECLDGRCVPQPRQEYNRPSRHRPGEIIQRHLDKKRKKYF